MTSCSNPITIYRADDTDAFGLRTMKIKITGDLDLTNATAKFNLLGFSKSWTNAETQTGELTFFLTSNDTKQMPLGECFGELILYDIQGATQGSAGKRLTVCNTIPFLVSNRQDCRTDVDLNVNVTLAVDTEVNIKVTIVGSTGSGSSLWQLSPSGKVLSPKDNTVERIAVPDLENVSALGNRYTLADVKNLVNTILAALKG